LVEVSDDQLVAGLGDLVEHWIEGGAVVYVLPPSEWLAAVLLKLLRQSVPVYDRRLHGKSVLLVETNEDQFQTDESLTFRDDAGRLGREIVHRDFSGAPRPSERRRPDDAGQRVLSVVATTTGSALPAATAPGSASREPAAR
jgi:hypothetical protein